MSSASADGSLGKYFEQLFTVDSQSGQLRTAGLQTVDADPPIDDVKEAVAKLRDRKAPVHTKILKCCTCCTKHEVDFELHLSIVLRAVLKCK